MDGHSGKPVEEKLKHREITDAILSAYW